MNDLTSGVLRVIPWLVSVDTVYAAVDSIDLEESASIGYRSSSRRSCFCSSDGTNECICYRRSLLIHQTTSNRRCAESHGVVGNQLCTLSTCCNVYRSTTRRGPCVPVVADGFDAERCVGNHATICIGGSDDSSTTSVVVEVSYSTSNRRDDIVLTKPGWVSSTAGIAYSASRYKVCIQKQGATIQWQVVVRSAIGCFTICACRTATRP